MGQYISLADFKKLNICKITSDNFNSYVEQIKNRAVIELEKISDELRKHLLSLLPEELEVTKGKIYLIKYNKGVDYEQSFNEVREFYYDKYYQKYYSDKYPTPVLGTIKHKDNNHYRLDQHKQASLHANAIFHMSPFSTRSDVIEKIYNKLDKKQQKYIAQSFDILHPNASLAYLIGQSILISNKISKYGQISNKSPHDAQEIQKRIEQEFDKLNKENINLDFRKKYAYVFDYLSMNTGNMLLDVQVDNHLSEDNKQIGFKRKFSTQLLQLFARDYNSYRVQKEKCCKNCIDQLSLPLLSYAHCFYHIDFKIHSLLEYHILDFIRYNS